MPAWFNNIFMRFSKIINKRMKAIDYQINNCQCEHNPHCIEQSFTFQIMFVQIGNNITYPGEHCKKHKKEVEKTINI